MKDLNIGLIGYGFMGKAHSNGYRRVNNFFDLEYRPVLKAVCGRDREKAQAFANQWDVYGICPKTDWRKVIEPQGHRRGRHLHAEHPHKEIALAAAKAGKMILCEKPLAMNGAEGREMVAAVEAAKVPNMVWYNYRRVPAVTLGQAGADRRGSPRANLLHFRALFLQ